MNEGDEETKGEVKKIEKGDVVTVEDSNNKKLGIHGTIKGFAIREPTRDRRMGGLNFGKRTSSVIIGLDREWEGKRVLCVLLE